jgi:hypothetical protein
MRSDEAPAVKHDVRFGSIASFSLTPGVSSASER